MSFAFPAHRIQRRALTAAAQVVALAAAAVLAGCAAPAPPPPPPVAVAPPPPPPVALAPRLVEQASAYRAYVTRAAAISPAFASGADVAAGVRTGAAYEPRQLLEGAIAYGAIAALQEPTFVAGVRVYATDATQRRTIAYEIMKDPAYVVGITGSAGAAGLVMNALGEDGRKLVEQGRAVRQAAYDVQRSSWSKADVAGRDARLAMAKQVSATPGLGEVAETARLQQAVVGGPLGLTPQSVSPPYTPMVIRSLAVAALAALGYADEASLPQVMPIMTDPSSATCLNMSKLNLFQCLAVAKPHYEDVFCLGVHVMADTGACLMKGVGVEVPADPRARPVTVAEEAAVTPASTKAPARPAPRRR